MTRINYIHGIPQVPVTELRDRGLEVKGQPFIPYTALSQGEMNVALAAERAQIFAQAYPDFPEYRTAAAMLTNALYSGVHNGVNFIGNLDAPTLQNVARLITRAKSQTRPASSGGFIGRQSLGIGVPLVAGIGAFTDMDCTVYARDKSNAFFQINKPSGWYKNPLTQSNYRKKFQEFEAECSTMNAIQKIVNERIEESSYHVVYNMVNEQFPGVKGSQMGAKWLFHQSGVGGLASVTQMPKAFIQEWSENGIIRTNAQGQTGPIGSVQSGFGIATDGSDAIFDAYAKKYLKSHRGMNGIGMAQVVVLALIALAGKAVDAASKFADALRQKQATAMAAAQGYGTTAYLAGKGDYELPDTSTGTGTDNSNLLLYGGLALGAYLLLSDD